MISSPVSSIAVIPLRRATLLIVKSKGKSKIKSRELLTAKAAENAKNTKNTKSNEFSPQRTLRGQDLSLCEAIPSSNHSPIEVIPR